MAVYEDHGFLRDAVESILAQDGVTFEFVIVDDGSSGETRGYLDGLDDPRIVMVRNPTNLGLTRSLNRGLESARGTFVARMDADDVALPGRLAAQARVLTRSNAHICFCRCQILSEATGERRIWVEGGWPLVRWRSLFTNAFGKHSAVMMRRDAVIDLGGYDASFRRSQDYELWDRCVAAGLRFAYVRKPLMLYRLHASAITERYATDQAGAAEEVSRRALKREFPDMGNDEIKGLRWLMLGGPDSPSGADIAFGLDRLRSRAKRFSQPSVWRDITNRLIRRIPDLEGDLERETRRTVLAVSLRSASTVTAARGMRTALLGRNRRKARVNERNREAAAS